jgi:MFS family permease
VIQAEESVERPYGWVVVVGSLLLMTVGAGGYYVVIVGLKLVAQDFGGLRWVPSMAYSMTVFGMGLGGIFIGRWSDRVGVGTPALLGSLMIVAGALTASVTTDRWVFLLAHGVLIGLLGNAALFSPLIANTARWFDRRRGMAVAMVTSAQAIAGVFWPSMFRILIEGSNWREAYRVYALVALVTMVPLSFLLRRPAPTAPEGDPREVSASDARVFGLTQNSVLVSLSAAIVCCCVAMAMPIVHVVSHATDLGYPLARASEMLAVLLGCAFFSRLAWGAVGDRVGGLRVLLIGSLCQALVLAMYLAVDSLIGLYVISALFGLAFGGIIPSYALIISQHFPPGSLGWRIATIFFFGAIGMAIGSWLGGVVFDITGAYRAAFAVGLLFNAIHLWIVGALVARGAETLEPQKRDLFA